jgi:predicted nucleotidyltransferase
MGGVRMKEKIKKIINQVFEEKGIKVERIILFGSRARGDFRENSDWDLLIIVSNELDLKDKRRISKEIRIKLAEIFIPCDVLIKSASEIEYYSNFIGTTTREALKEGVEI